MNRFVLCFAIGGLASAQDWQSVQRAKRALDAISHAHTGQEADRQREGLRRRLTESLGVERLPWPPDLQVRSAGVLRRPGYRIEKIIYQTLPGVLVAAHLYVPDNLKGRAPAILHYTGHWWEYGKAEPDFQAFCASMASQGFVVLIFEAFGQGERGVSARDHRRVEALLAGVSQHGLAEYETRCALEYLFSRKEVDPKRVGMTGASGGGYNTWINTSLDDRIAARRRIRAFPSTGTGRSIDTAGSFTSLMERRRRSGSLWTPRAGMVTRRRNARRLTGRAGAVFRGKPIAVYARGNNAALAAMYLVPNQDGLRWYILRDGFVSFRQFIDRPKSLEASYRLRGGDGRNMWFDREIPLGYFPFDVLRSFDLAQLVAATSAPGLVVNPIDGDWERMNGDEARGYVPAGLRVVSEDNPEGAIVRFVH
jgi:Acetyl xylan esterase (AXE1)